MTYDATAGFIETPDGPGKYVEFDGAHGTVTVEMDHSHLVIYPASLCYINHREAR